MIIVKGASGNQTYNARFNNSVVSAVETGGTLPAVDGIYLFVGVPSGGLPLNVASGDIAQRISGVWIRRASLIQAESAVYDNNLQQTWAKQTGSWQLQPNVKVVRTTGTQNFTVTALADVTGLSTPVLSGKTYEFTIGFHYSAAATTTGLAVGVVVPAGTLRSHLLTASNAAGGSFNIGIVASGTAGIATASRVVAATNYAQVNGFFACTTSGTMQIRAASEIAASQIQTQVGSFLRILEDRT